MKYFAFIIAVFLLFPALAQPGSVEQIAGSEKIHKGKRMHQKADTDPELDLHYLRAQWEVNPAVRYIRGKVAQHFVTRKQLNAVVFDLSSAHSVSEVLLDGAAVSFSRPGDQVVISTSIPAGAKHVVEITYEGEPPNTGLGTFEVRTHEGVPILWTLSEPYGAPDWWPCRQNLADKTDSSDFFIIVPKGNSAAGNGKLVAVTEYSSTQDMFHWQHRYPVAVYLVAMAVTNYVSYTDTAWLRTGTLPVVNMVYPEAEENARVQTQQVLRLLHLYDSLFTPYPFMKEKYGHAQFGWGGGMEHQTMSFMGNFTFDLQAHELAHQWFGDAVTCGAWEDIWLNEGFATYLTGLAYEFDTSAVNWHTWKSNNISSITSLPGGSVYIPVVTSENRIFESRLSYRKGAMVLHMLRWIIGDSLFFEGVRSYLTHPELSYSFAKTPDFLKVMEEVSGMDLGYYFDDWVYGEGYPGYLIEWSAAGNVLTFKAFQEQSHASVDFFELPLELMARGDGKDTLLRVEHTFNGQAFILEPGFPVENLYFDPNLRIVSKGNLVVRREPDLRSEITLFPQPAGAFLRLRFLSSSPQQQPVQIFDVAGREVAAPLVSESGNLLTVDISSLATGTYFIAVEYRGQRVTLPFTHLAGP